MLNKFAKQIDNLEAIDRMEANFPTRSHSEYSEATESGNYTLVLSQPAVPHSSKPSMPASSSQHNQAHMIHLITPTQSHKAILPGARYYCLYYHN